MSDHLVPRGPTGPFGDNQLQSQAQSQLQAWQEPLPAAPARAASPFERPIAAIRRYKWLILVIIALSIGAGVAATRLVTPQYEVRASIMITEDSPMENRSGPIRSAGLLSSDDWTQLLKSFTIMDAVVRRLSLYLQPANYTDAVLFDGFTLGDKFVPGKYELVIDQTNKRWTLSSLPSGAEVDAGTATDSVGRKLGFAWRPPDWVFNSTGTRKVKFTVSTPREMAVKLGARLGTQRQQESNFLLLTLQDRDPQLAARIVNTWARDFVSVAADLKRRKLADFAKILGGQLQTAKASLDSAEIQLSSFRVNTITQPSEGGPIAAGTQETRDPVIKSYFDKKIQYDDIRHDVGLLQRLLGTGSDSVNTDALLQIRSVASGEPASQELRSALTEYHAAVTDLSAARVGFTDDHPVVKNLIEKVNTLQRQKIPRAATALMVSLQSRAVDDSIRIAGASVNLQKIPQRTIEEERLRRVRDIASSLYTNLQNRYSEAQLAEASAAPDVALMDSAIAPLAPTKNTAPGLMLMAIVGGIGAAIGLAILLDKVDGKLRYAQQIGDELGLPIAGTIPRLPKGGVDHKRPEQAFQLVESFRSLRMTVMSASGGESVSVAISSPSPAEGKSLISANLAMSFAEAGLRTVLVDGDTRRGALHKVFGVRDAPGLTDYLAGTVALDEVIRPTAQDTLQLIPCGTRKRRSPELLISARLPALVAELRTTHDVVIFDTPPLAAGIDAYSIGVATGSLLLVVRVGRTARRMAVEKLRMFDRLPVELIGAVLNGITYQGEYAYYSYVPGYEAVDEPERKDLVKVT